FDRCAVGVRQAKAHTARVGSRDMLRTVSGAILYEAAIEHVFANVPGVAERFNPFNAGDGIDPLDHAAVGAPTPHGTAGAEISRRRRGYRESQELAARARPLRKVPRVGVVQLLEQWRRPRAQQHGEVKSPEEHHVGIEDAVTAFRKSIGCCDLENAMKM